MAKCEKPRAFTYTLELTEFEAVALYKLLGMHSTGSVIKTFSIFDALSDALAEDGLDMSIEDHFNLMKRVKLLEGGLITVESE